MWYGVCNSEDGVFRKGKRMPLLTLHLNDVSFADFEGNSGSMVMTAAPSTGRWDRRL